MVKKKRKKLLQSTDQEVLYSKGKNDNLNTLSYAVKPILKYIPHDAIVWCPFDTKDSEFVKQITNNGNKVIHTHIRDGYDFYEYEPSMEWDCIVSNPPFTNKRKIFERCLDFGKPFALIMTNTWLNDSAPVNIFLERNRQLQLLMFDKRMKFEQNGVIEKKITFSSSYFCCDFLPRDLIQEHLNIEETVDGKQGKLI